MMFIVSQLMTKKEKDELSQIFMSLDKNGDGALTHDELLEGYCKLYGNKERAINEVKYLLDVADADNNGVIDYSEFLLASANKKKLLSKGNVKQAFDLFDTVNKLLFKIQDHSGFISPEEIKAILGLGKKINEQIWADVIAEVDKNKDGQVSYEEFESMMSMFIS